MEAKINGLVGTVIALVVIILVIFLVVKYLYEPNAIDSAVKQTQPSSQTVGGHVYNFTGNGLDPTVEGQKVIDQDNRSLAFVTVLGGFAIFVLIVLSVTGFFGGKKHY